MYGFQPKSPRGKAMPKLADGGVVPFGSRGVAAVRDLIPKMQAMGFQPAPPPAAPADTSNTARLRAMIPQMEAMGYKQQPQYLADGGMVDSIKGMFGIKPEDPERARRLAEYQANAAREKEAAKAATAPAPAPAHAITDYAAGSALKRREAAAGLKDGGPCADQALARLTMCQTTCPRAPTSCPPIRRKPSEKRRWAAWACEALMST